MLRPMLTMVTPRSPSPISPSRRFSSSAASSIRAPTLVNPATSSAFVSGMAQTLQNAQAAGALRYVSSSSSSLQKVKDTPVISIDVA